MRALLPVLMFLCGCHADHRYPGDARPPDARRLVFANGAEPTTLGSGLVGMTPDAMVQRCLYGKLALCETRLLEEMAVIPLTFISSNYLEKPYVRGIRRDLFGDVFFRYAWIDTGQPGKEDRP